ncbi:MAG: hypothetical protein HY851_02420 [candidate division Zixibacteria bacterium]|nr:hypothetical protein [candidate division Zixibacteria bacterium]
MRIAGIVAAMFIIAVVLPTSAQAQTADRTSEQIVQVLDGPFEQAPDAPMAGRPGPGGPDRQEMERQRRHLEQLRMLKLLEVLDLKDSKEEPFLMAFRAMRKSQRDLDEQKKKLLARLSETIQSPSRDDRKINALTDSVVQISDQKRAQAGAFLAKARTILNAEQTAKLVIFEERFEYELLERVREFRRMGRMGGPMRDPMDSN